MKVKLDHEGEFFTNTKWDQPSITAKDLHVAYGV